MRSLLGIVIWVVGFSLSSFKYVLPFPSGLKSFNWKISCYPYWDPLVLFVAFPLLLLLLALCDCSLLVWLICVLWFFQWSCIDVSVGLWRKLSSEGLMLLNCCVGESLRVPWTARRSNQSILKESSPGCSLEGLMLKLKLQYFDHLMTHLKRLWCWEGLGAGGEGDNRG